MRYGLILGVSLFFLSPFIASANVEAISSNPSHGKRFSFYCHPYKASFIANYHYMPVIYAGTGCVYSLPSTIAGEKMIELRRGVPTNSIPLTIDTVGGSPTLVRQQQYGTVSANPDDTFFAVVYDSSLGDNFRNYLTSGGPLPVGAVENQSYYVLPWKWGPTPVEEFQPVVIIPGILGSWEKNGEWVLDPITHTYDNLVDTFKANGYIEGETLFTFPYDWRESNITTAFLLKNRIQQIKEVCGCSHVDVIAHSMGGLVSLEYIGRDDYANDINRLFLVATPLSGAPLAYLAWEGGELDFGDPRKTFLMQRIFKNEARESGYSNIFDYIKQSPVNSIQELLPVYQNYLGEDGNRLTYPEGYPVNGFLANLMSKFGQTYRKVDMHIAAANLEGPTTTLEAFDIKPSTQLPKWEHGEPTEIYYGEGDGTVPIYSIFNVIDPDIWLGNVSHTEAASTSAPYIFKELHKRDLTVIVGNKFTVWDIGWKVLFIKLFSPIDMQIVAPDGKRLGKDFETSTEIAEIPGAFYSGFGTDNEYAVIVNPLPGTYTIKTTGTGDGSYTIVADLIDQTGSHEAEVTGTTTIQQNKTTVLTVSATSTSVTLEAQQTTPPSPPVVMTPQTCVQDITQAYTNKWITKKSVYTALIADCTALKALFQTQDLIKEIVPAKRDKIKTALLKATEAAIARILDNMDKWAEDKTNTKDAVELINNITTWFRANKLGK